MFARESKPRVENNGKISSSYFQAMVSRGIFGRRSTVKFVNGWGVWKVLDDLDTVYFVGFSDLLPWIKSPLPRIHVATLPLKKKIPSDLCFTSLFST